MNRAITCLTKQFHVNGRQMSRNMSLMPYFRSDPFERAFKEMQRLERTMERHFRNDFHPAFNRILEIPSSFAEIEKEFGNAIIGKDGFQVSLDVSQFKPNEITVKILDNILVIEGKHDERSLEDNGTVSRHFVRKWILPEDKIDVAQLQSSLSSDGVLTMIAPKLKIDTDSSKERIIPLNHTGPAKDNVKEIKSEEKTGHYSV